MYDIIFIGDKETNSWSDLKTKFPTAKHATTFDQANKKSLTKMFWAVYPDLNLNPEWNFEYIADDYSLDYVHMFNNGNYKDGIALHPKNKIPSTNELKYRYYISKKVVDISASTPRPFDRFTINTYEDYLFAYENSTTDMFWGVPDDIIIQDDSVFNFYIPHESSDRKSNHSWLNGEHFDGLNLFSKHSKVIEKEITYRFLANKIEHNKVVSIPKAYEIFDIETYEDYQDALAKAKGDLFFMSSPNIKIKEDFSFYISHHNQSDRKQTHAFKHCNDLYNGLFLCSKHRELTKKEVEYRFPVNRIEHNTVATEPCIYDKFYIETYEDYLYALENSKTEMFWMLSHNLKVAEDFNFDIYFTHDNEFDRNANHAFIHRVNNKDLYNGIFLCSKKTKLSEKEVNYRFPVNRKEWNIVASGMTEYDTFEIETYEEYCDALEKSHTELFWIVFKNVDASNFKKDLYFSHDNEYDRKTNHTFIHDDEGNQLRNGVWLCSKHMPISKKEVEYRFVVNAKEHNEIASTRKLYDKFTVKTYEDYCKAYDQSTQEMFWTIPNNVEIVDDSIFETYYPAKHIHDQEYKFERNINHVYQNGLFHDGVILSSKKCKITQREWDYGFIVTKNETNIQASMPKPFDIVFISYQEEKADENYQKLLSKYPHAKRIHGVKGIHNAHIAAAQQVNTEMFWVVDGDAELKDDFEFVYQVPRWDHDVVHVWRSENPINGLIYGYGGVKLLPTDLTINMNTATTDMTTSISSKFKAVEETSNVTRFDTDPFSAWKSGFRECVKLAKWAKQSQHVYKKTHEATEERLKIWCTQGSEKQYGKYCIAGAIAGKKHGEKNFLNTEELNKINDFRWLEEKFNKEFNGKF